MSKNTFTLTVLFIFNLFLQLFIQLILAKHFGTKVEMDAYFVAIVYPEYVLSLFGGILNVVFIPLFVEELNSNKKQAWYFAGGLFGWLIITLSFISLIMIFYPGTFYKFWFFTERPETYELSTKLLRIISPIVLLGTLHQLLMLIHNVHNEFIKPALTSLISSSTTAIFVIFGYKIYGIESLAWGRVVGLLICCLYLTKILFNKDFVINIHINTSIKKFFHLSAPLFFASILFKSDTLFERWIAAQLDTGSISYLGYSQRILSIVLSILSQLVIVVFPALSYLWFDKNIDRFKYYFIRSFQSIIMFGLAFFIIVILYSKNIITILFEHGLFTNTDTNAVYILLVIGMLTTIFSSLGNLVAKGLYVSQKIIVSIYISILTIFVYFISAWILSKYLSYIGLGLSMLIQSIVGMSVTLIFVSKLLKGFNHKILLKEITKLLFAFLFTLLAGYYLLNPIVIFDTKLFEIIIKSLILLIMYVLFGMLTRSTEIGDIMKLSLNYLKGLKNVQRSQR